MTSTAVLSCQVIGSPTLSTQGALTDTSRPPDAGGEFEKHGIIGQYHDNPRPHFPPELYKSPGDECEPGDDPKGHDRRHSLGSKIEVEGTQISQCVVVDLNFGVVRVIG
ncbi:unnamed protein product [Clonostachys rosea f. rosea IK726]|uniref:Uncharacterized protein n=2 Tax=Bionectria ochroleuca TaxID=29856 RepID=A0A0B7JTV7_BIOOC|nr:unnamed protein product [Clonostachys rosea f. rosea IK726]